MCYNTIYTKEQFLFLFWPRRRGFRQREWQTSCFAAV